jgi:hypothetical protein
MDHAPHDSGWDCEQIASALDVNCEPLRSRRIDGKVVSAIEAHDPRLVGRTTG